MITTDIRRNYGCDRVGPDFLPCTLASSQSAGNRLRRREHGARERERCTESVVRESEDGLLHVAERQKPRDGDSPQTVTGVMVTARVADSGQRPTICL